MHSAEDLDLPYLEMDQPWFAENPVPHFAEARRRHPWLARWKFGFALTDFQAIRDIYRMEDRLRTKFGDIVDMMGADGTPWGRFQQNHISNRTGADHRRLRDLLAPSFTPRQANLHRGLMRGVIARLLDEWVPRGAFDFEEFASWFPITVTCSLIGASSDDIPGLRSSMEAIGLSTSMDRKYLPAMQEGIVVLDEFVHRLAADRRAGKRLEREQDLLDLLLEAQQQGGLTDREIADLLIFLFVAGYDTSKNVLTLTMYELLARPDLYRRCGDDPAFCHKVVDEVMRFHSSANSSRVLAEDIVYRDVQLPKDALIWFPLSIAGRFPGAIEDPEEFRPERAQPNAHLAFGLGPHICLGQYLARAQIEEGLHQIAQRIANPRSPTGPSAWRPFPGVWGIRGLPIEFNPVEIGSAGAR